MKLLFTWIMVLVTGVVFAQGITLTGKVVDSQGLPIPGATLTESGTRTLSITDAEGKFTFSSDIVPFTLRVSFIGFQTYQVEVTSTSSLSEIVLTESTSELNEVLVTALGIERNRQSLTSAVSVVDNRALSDVPQPNLINALSGLVAGVQVTNGSSGVGSSSRIVIRGENSLSGNNEALIVVDGVPIQNNLIASVLFNDGANIQEVDYGNGAADLSPDDIASISILKGPGSAALYGTRGANGVVLITTKKGGKTQGLGVSTSSIVTFEDLLTLPAYQNEYGGGTNGQYAFQNGIGAGINDGGISSFGPRLNEGQFIAQFDSPSVDIRGNPVRAGDVLSRTFPNGTYTPITPTPWISRPNNVKDFFRTGVTSQQAIALNGGDEKGGFRAGYINFRNQGILPNTDLKRDGLSLSLDRQLTDRLRFDLFSNYVNSRSNNRPGLGYGYENVMYGFNWTGRNFNIASLRDYWQAGQEGIQHFDFNYLWTTNPYLTLFENTNGFDKNRFLGNASGTYDFTDKLSLRVRLGADIFDDIRTFRRAFSTNRRVFGGYREDQISFQEINTDFLLSYADRLGSQWTYSISIGANRMNQEISNAYTEANQLALPGIYNLENSRVPLRGASQEFSKRINSIYSFGNLAFKDHLFVELTVRNDWSSTLPASNNSFAYYSGGVNYVMSEAVQLPKKWSYAAIRFNAASVGNDTDPYQLNNTFQFNQNYGSFIRVTNRTVLNNPQLKPERLNALEAGLNLGWFRNRVMLDVSAYQNTSINQIIGRPISTATGFSNRIENGGEVRTRGLEAALSGSVISKKDLEWTMGINFSTYRSVVTQLPDGVTQYVTGEASVFAGAGGSNTVFYIARENGRIGDMYGTGFRMVEGQVLYGSNGLPIQDATLRLLGNYNPDFILGFTNRLSFKRIQISMVWDWRQGGTIVSRTRALGSTSGVLKETLEGREIGIVGQGVVNVGTAENPQYVPNTTVVSASSFYNNFFDRGNEASALYNASYLKIRQLSIYYSLPEAWISRIGFEQVKVGFVGSNLLLFTENPHFDPELNAMQGQRLTYGVEDMSYPSTRSFGFSIKTEF
ncbi:SusC/RagA family TonB-linked outer membrane protein [Algoriphagus lacus]|uniref:SusC/RagA family TonB-linked outer membrane protein n=1 Tax=Algoriphagus lacus TaxID=2056311 RepID=A0A418PNS6_9BACT|nr:SusC/RagA family TonB-linked outer membrane protein [Algoriphagus lacus]RIW13311.1 SusC/RagA family TonB-linked outer membrane protein [Algoriphagus lacus]